MDHSGSHFPRQSAQYANTSISASERARSPHQLQFGLRELVLVVSSIALTLGVARHSLWAGWQHAYNLFGLLLIPVSVWLATALVAQLVRLAINSKTGGRARGAPVGMLLVCWRVIAILLLAGYVILETNTLLLESRTLEAMGTVSRFEINTSASVVSGMLVTIGLVIGMQSVPSVGTVEKRSRLPVAAIGWVVLMALMLAGVTEGMCIPYLVLIAVEAVSHATRYWEGNGPGALVRLSQSFVPVSLCVVGCLLSGVWQSHTLHRRPSNDNTGVVSRLRLVRGITGVFACLAPVTAATYVVFELLPSVHTQFAELFWAIPTNDAVSVAIGFSCLSAGITARAATIRPVESIEIRIAAPELDDRILPIAFLAKIAVAVIAISITALSLIAILARQTTALFLPQVLGLTNLPVALWGWIRDQLDSGLMYMAMGLMCVAIPALRMMCTRALPGICYFDSVLNTQQIGRFLWNWLSLTVLIISAVPVLFVAGLFSYHYFLFMID